MSETGSDEDSLMWEEDGSPEPRRRCGQHIVVLATGVIAVAAPLIWIASAGRGSIRLVGARRADDYNGALRGMDRDWEQDLSWCSVEHEDCSGSRCCQDPDHVCFEKNAKFAGCRLDCSPGVYLHDPENFEHWTCRVIDIIRTKEEAMEVLSSEVSAAESAMTSAREKVDIVLAGNATSCGGLDSAVHDLGCAVVEAKSAREAIGELLESLAQSIRDIEFMRVSVQAGMDELVQARSNSNDSLRSTLEVLILTVERFYFRDTGFIPKLLEQLSKVRRATESQMSHITAAAGSFGELTGKLSDIRAATSISLQEINGMVKQTIGKAGSDLEGDLRASAIAVGSTVRLLHNHVQVKLSELADPMEQARDDCDNATATALYITELLEVVQKAVPEEGESSPGRQQGAWDEPIMEQMKQPHRASDEVSKHMKLAGDHFYKVESMVPELSSRAHAAAEQALEISVQLEKATGFLSDVICEITEAGLAALAAQQDLQAGVVGSLDYSDPQAD